MNTSELSLGEYEYRHVDSEYLIEVIDPAEESRDRTNEPVSARRLFSIWDLQRLLDKVESLPTPAEYKDIWKTDGECLVVEGHGPDEIKVSIRHELRRRTFTIPRSELEKLREWVRQLLSDREPVFLLRSGFEAHIMTDGKMVCDQKDSSPVSFPLPGAVLESDVPYFIPMEDVTPGLVARCAHHGFLCETCMSELPERLLHDPPRVGTYRCAVCGHPWERLNEDNSAECLDPQHFRSAGEIFDDIRKWLIEGEAARTPKRTELTDF